MERKVKEKDNGVAVKSKKGWAKVIIFFLVITFLIGIVSLIKFKKDTPDMVEYQEFVSDLESGNIDTIFIDRVSSNIRYTLLNEDTREMDIKARDEYKGTKEWKRTYYPNYADFTKDALESGAAVQVKSFRPWIVPFITYATSFIPTFAICLMVYLVYVQVDKMGLINNKKTATIEEISSNIKLSDIVGHDEAIEEIKSVADLMNSNDNKFGARIPKGLLLIGPPGTGKTMVAKALANEINTKFYYLNSSSIIEMYAGLGAKKIRDIFSKVRNNTPCILFIDEIDAIGKKRNSKESKTSEDNQVIDALLQEMDGFKDVRGVFFIAASNRYEDLDPALVRSGRFDRKIVLNPPRNWEARLELFRKYTIGLDIKEEELGLLAKQTSGMTGADIDKIVNEAKLIATRQKKDRVDLDSLEEALDNSLTNGSRTNHISEKDKQTVAYHESGHAVYMLLHNMPIARMSILPSTSGTGGMVVRTETDYQMVSKHDIENIIASLYAGRISEEILLGFDECTIGASNDIEKATELLVNYVGKFGFDNDMVDYIKLASAGILGKEEFVGKVERIANRIYKSTRQELNDNKHLIEKLAEEIKEKETMTGKEVQEFYMLWRQSYGDNKQTE